MKITIEGETIAEVASKVAMLANVFGVGSSSTPVDTIPSASAPAVEAVPSPALTAAGVPQKKRGPKPKDKTQLASPESEAEAPAETEAKEAVATKEDAMKALTEVTSKRDMASARAVLAEFGASRFSEVPEERYKDFIAACMRAVSN